VQEPTPTPVVATPTPRPTATPAGVAQQSDKGAIEAVYPLNKSIVSRKIKLEWRATGKAASHDIRAEYSVDLGDTWIAVQKPHPLAEDQNIYLDTTLLEDVSGLMVRFYDKDAPEVKAWVSGVVVDNTPPEAYCGDYDVPEGGSVWLNSSPATDAGSGVKSYYWRVNGTEESTESKFKPAITNKTQGSSTLPVLLRVVDGVGNNNSFNCVIRVANVRPSPVFTSENSLPEGQNFSFRGSFTDPGKANGEKYQYRFEFGDGAVQSGALNASHAFVNPGAYLAKFFVSDGEEAVFEKNVTVANVKPVLTGSERVGSESAPNRYLFSWNFTHPPGVVVTGAIEYRIIDEFNREVWNTACSASSPPFECVYDFDGLPDGTYQVRLGLDDGTEKVYQGDAPVTVTHPRASP
jgi:hypothetical protein